MRKLVVLTLLLFAVCDSELTAVAAARATGAVATQSEAVESGNTTQPGALIGVSQAVSRAPNLVDKSCHGDNCVSSILEDKGTLYISANVTVWIALIIAIVLSSYRFVASPKEYFKLLLEGFGADATDHSEPQQQQQTTQTNQQNNPAGEQNEQAKNPEKPKISWLESIRRKSVLFKMNINTPLVSLPLILCKYLQDTIAGQNPAMTQIIYMQIFIPLAIFFADQAVSGNLDSARSLKPSLLVKFLLFCVVIWIDTVISVNLVLLITHWSKVDSPHFQFLWAVLVTAITLSLYVNFLSFGWAYEGKLWGQHKGDKIKTVLVFVFAAMLALYYFRVVDPFNQALTRNQCLNLWNSHVNAGQSYCATYLAGDIVACRTFCEDSHYPVADESLCLEMRDGSSCQDDSTAKNQVFVHVATVVIVLAIFLLTCGSIIGFPYGLSIFAYNKSEKFKREGHKKEHHAEDLHLAH